MQLDGEGLAVRAQGTFNDGRLDALQVSRLVLGATVAQRQRAVSADPAGAGPIVVNVSGPDASTSRRTSARRATGAETGASQSGTRGRAALDGRCGFDRVLMAHDVVVERRHGARARMTAVCCNRRAWTADTRARAPFSVQITPEKGGRRVTANAGGRGRVCCAGWTCADHGRRDAVVQGDLRRRACLERPLSGTRISRISVCTGRSALWRSCCRR